MTQSSLIAPACASHATGARTRTIAAILSAVLFVSTLAFATPAFATTKKPSNAAARTWIARKNPMGDSNNDYKVLSILKVSGAYWAIIRGHHPGDNAATRVRATYVTRCKSKKWRIVAGEEESPFDAAQWFSLPLLVRNKILKLQMWAYWSDLPY